jgi:Na+/H+-dicarboxylate symporter
MAVAESQRLTRQIAMLAGMVPGVGMNRMGTPHWVQLRLVVGVTALPDLKTLGRIGVKTLFGNVTGDCVVNCIVAQSENALGQTVFDDPAAGSVEAATRHAIPSPRNS